MDTSSGNQAWDFAEFTSEVKTTEDGFKESYNGLTITLANNGGDSDHDKISTAGVYWRGAVSSGDSTRYIVYTPSADGTLYATGKLNANGGRWGISASLDVSSFSSDHSTQSTSSTTVSMPCTAGTTYYIYAKSKSATVTKVEYKPTLEVAETYTHTDYEGEDAGYTVTLSGGSINAGNTINWYAWNDKSFGKIGSGTLSTNIESSGDVKIGLVVKADGETNLSGVSYGAAVTSAADTTVE